MDFSVNQADFGLAKDLYGNMFGKKYADMFFSHMANLSNTFVIKENNDVASVAFAIDKTFVSGDTHLRAIYICGVATREESRGKHYSKTLLDFIETKYKNLGYDFAYLVPASGSLFNMYEKYGYETAFYLNVKEYEAKGYALSPDKERWCSVPERYSDYAKRFDLYQARSACDWDFIKCEFEDRILNYSSCGYVIYYADDKEIVIRESTLQTETQLLGAISYIAKKSGAKCAKVFSPAQDDCDNTPYAMVKYFSDRAKDVFKNSKTKYTNANFE